jgi:beta-galactosidase
VSNRQSFSALDGYVLTWELLVDGRVVKHGRLVVPDVAPHASAVVPLPVSVPIGDGEVAIRFSASLRRDQWWAPAGHTVAWDEIELRARRAPRRSSAGWHDGPVVVEPLVAGPSLNLWRATTDNDGYKLMPELGERHGIGGKAMQRWQRQGVDRLDPEDLVVHRVRHRIVDAGAEFDHLVDVPAALADLPRIGVTFTLPPRFDRLRWFGRGPGENYPDRLRGSMLGIWESGVDECPYLVPQEFGLRSECRWFEFIDTASGQVVRLETLGDPLHVSATYHTAADLFAAATVSELHGRNELIVCVDAAHRGVGTASCGPDTLPQYLVPAGRCTFGYRLTANVAG